MIPFPGESIALFDAWDDGDWSLGNDLIRRDGSRTITSGDQWRAWVSSGDTNYLDDDTTPVETFWAVEVLSGTVTLNVSEGVDPDYGDPFLAPSTSLGTHTVTGPATLVVPSTFTGAQVVNTADADISFMLVLDATSGSADVQQVKLRVYPVGRPVGAWGDEHPARNEDPSNATILYANPTPTITGAATDADAETSWDAAYTAFSGNVAPESAATSRAFTLARPGACSASQSIGKIDLSTFSSGTTLVPNVALIFGVDWHQATLIDSALVEGVDWIVPPGEVPSDTEYLAQRVGEGSTGWLNAVVTVTAEGDMPGTASAASQAGAFPFSSGHATVPVLHGGPDGAVPLDTGGQRILVGISHTVTSGDGATWPGWTPGLFASQERVSVISYAFGVDGNPVQTFAALPPYRVWAPTATPRRVPLRQFHRDDGLGVAPPRAFGGASRIRTGRAYGYD